MERQVESPEFVPFGPMSDDAGTNFAKDIATVFLLAGDFQSGTVGGALYRPQGHQRLRQCRHRMVETAPARATLIHTLEVVGVSGQRIGLIVLPTHPLRVAWQQGFDMLVWRHPDTRKALHQPRWPSCWDR